MANSWGSSWDGDTGAWLTSWGSAGSTPTPTPSPTPTPTPAGHSRRRRLFVEIDGENFEVRDAQHAQALLDRARELAKSHAEELAKAALRTNRKIGKKPVSLPTPRISSPDPELREVVRQARKAINQVYRSAALDTELAMLMLRKMAEEDEEEAILLLL